MTKVLFITNKDDLTTDFVVREIQKQHIDFYRLNTEEIGISVQITIDAKQSYFRIYDINQNQEHSVDSFTAVYFRRPVVRDFMDYDLTVAERQFMRIEYAQTLEGLYKVLKDAFWVSPVEAIRNAENKIYQQILATKVGLSIPAGMVTNNAKDFERFWDVVGMNCIVKPVRSGQIGQPKTEKIVYTSILDRLPSCEQIEICPTYIQEHISKRCDVRVTIVGKKIFSTAILSQGCKETMTDWRRGEHVLPYKEIALPQDIEEKCLQMMDALGLQFGAIDFIHDENGKYVFLEINPNGQWAWIECRTNYHIAAEIANLLINESN